MRKCLVTGAAGFIGSTLIHKLLAEGADVYGVDLVPQEQASNLKKAFQFQNFHYAPMDVSKNTSWGEMLPGASEIYILASVVGVHRVVTDPSQTINTALAQIHTLEQQDLTGKTVFFASTSEVYGKTKPHWFSSELDDLVLGSPSKPRWAYACSKLLAEHLLIALSKTKGFSLKIGRLFNVVGPGQNMAYGAVLPNFVSRALVKQPILVYGDGSQTRSFCHVQDVVEGIIHLTRSAKTHYEVFNIGSPSAISILELAQVTQRYFGNASNIAFEPYDKVMPEGFEEIMHRAPDVSKIQNHTGWQCKFGVLDVIRDMDLHLQQIFNEKSHQ